jgi:(p)ppGpp synthase/HD superfamily hydrolase
MKDEVGQNPRINQATIFASHIHAGQLRKYTGAPYVLHLWGVYWRVREYRGSIDQQITAWLHDAIEDTETTAEEIETMFGPVVRGLVVELTDVYTTGAYPTWNRAKRKAAETKRKTTISDEACLVKLADIYDNFTSFEVDDPDMAKTTAGEIGPFLDDCRDRRNLGLAGNALRELVILKVERFR